MEEEIKELRKTILIVVGVLFVLVALRVMSSCNTKKREHSIKTYDCGLDATYLYTYDTCSVETIEKIDSHGNYMRVLSK